MLVRKFQVKVDEDQGGHPITDDVLLRFSRHALVRLIERLHLRIITSSADEVLRMASLLTKEEREEMLKGMQGASQLVAHAIECSDILNSNLEKGDPIVIRLLDENKWRSEWGPSLGSCGIVLEYLGLSCENPERFTHEFLIVTILGEKQIRHSRAGDFLIELD